MMADTDESQTTAIQEDNQNTTYEFDSNPSESTSEQNGEGGTGGQEPNEEDDHPEQPPEETNESTTTTPAQYICQGIVDLLVSDTAEAKVLRENLENETVKKTMTLGFFC